MIAKAYENGQWDAIGAVTGAKDATQYKGISFIEEVCGAPMRLLVLESDTLQRTAAQAVAQKEAGLAPIIKALEKNQWMCLADAEAAREKFLSTKELALFDCDAQIEKRVEKKWPKGRRGANTEPTLKETYHIHVENITKSEQACQDFLHRESCIVLISNVTDGTSDEDLLKIYKGQQIVENSFRMLKSPQLASVIYLKSQTRIQALNMLLTFSLLLRALVQYRLREGLKSFKEEHPDEKIYAGWNGRALEAPTFKLLYEHSVNCYFEHESRGKYSFAWPSDGTRRRVEPLLALMGISLEQLVK
jgi:transposase